MKQGQVNPDEKDVKPTSTYARAHTYALAHTHKHAHTRMHTPWYK